MRTDAPIFPYSGSWRYPHGLHYQAVAPRSYVDSQEKFSDSCADIEFSEHQISVGYRDSTPWAPLERHLKLVVFGNMSMVCPCENLEYLGRISYKYGKCGAGRQINELPHIKSVHGQCTRSVANKEGQFESVM
jgi:hypothetical protein